jgi:hypothetical protein
MMRTVWLACAAPFIAACGIADFNVSQDIPEQHVPGSAIPGPLAALFPVPINLDISSKIKARNTGPIDGVTLSSLALTITATDRPSGDTDDWAFVTHIDVFVQSTKSGSTLPRVKIATVSSPGAVQTMAFEVDGGVNLKPYVEEGSQIDTEASATAPSDDVSYAGSSVFTVHPL